MIHHTDDAKFSHHMLVLESIDQERGAAGLVVKNVFKCVVQEKRGRILPDLPDSSDDLRLVVSSKMSN